MYLVPEYKKRSKRSDHRGSKCCVIESTMEDKCRICLVEDFQLCSIVGTHLQEMYESLVSIPFERKDGRSTLVCYICSARLQNCYELRKSCLWSEEIFTQMLSGYELKPLKLQEIHDKRLTLVNNVVQLSIGHVLQTGADNVGNEALKCEIQDTEDFEEDTLGETSICDNIPSTELDDGWRVKSEQPGDMTSDPTPKIPMTAGKRAPADLIFSKFKENDPAQDAFKEFQITTAYKIPITNTNETKFSLSNNKQTRASNVPHTESVQYTCDTCQKCYSSKCKLETHMRFCSDVWKKDISCENNINYTSNRSTCTGNKPHQCRMCEKSFSTKWDLSRHMRTHTDEKPYQCSVCENSFTAKKDLTMHIRKHAGEKPYQCRVCAKSFSNKFNLSRHMRRHTGEKRYHCSVCENSFTTVKECLYDMSKTPRR